MKYIIKPAIKVFGKYIGEANDRVGLKKGVKYELDEIYVSRDGNMYASTLAPILGRVAAKIPAIAASKFEFVDEYGFKYEPPFRKGMVFKYQYDPYHFHDRSGAIHGQHYTIQYAYNDESCDLVYVIYPAFENGLYLTVPLFEGTFEYTVGNIPTIINGRISASSNNEANPTITYRLNKQVIATMKHTNNIYEFTRYWVNDTTSEISSFSLSKFKNDYVLFMSNPSKHIDENPGFCEAKFSSIASSVE